MAKLFSTLGYAVDAGGRGADRLRDLLRAADGSVPEPAGSLGDLEPAGEGEECDVVIVGSGAGGAVAAATLAEAGLDVLVLEAGGHYDRDSYPSDHLEAIATPLPRRRPDDRRGPAADPGAGRARSSAAPR